MASESWILKWREEEKKYKRLGIPLKKLDDRIVRHKASQVIGREFGEDVQAYLKRKQLTKYHQWKRT